MKLEHPRRQVHYVADASGLQAMLDEISILEQIGLDAERASGFRYSNSAYLIQIATPNNIYLLDPVAPDLPENWEGGLAEAMSRVTWILHSATQDLPCLAELGIRPSSIIDTELAARFLGVERFGLASLAATFLDLELAKEHSAADWSVRPLDDGMLNYAALDVDILFELWDKLLAELTGSEKLGWLQQEFERLVRFEAKPVSEQPWLNLPGMSKVKDHRRIQIAASLWLTRDKLARELDSAPGRLIPDRSIAAVVAEPPSSKAELAQNKQFHGRAARSKINLWWQAISDAGKVEISPAKPDPDHIPNHRSWEKRFPEPHARLSAIRPLLLETAEQLGIAVELLLTPDTLRRVMFQPGESISNQLASLGARPWQVEICEPIIRAGLEQLQTEPPAA